MWGCGENEIDFQTSFPERSRYAPLPFFSSFTVESNPIFRVGDRSAILCDGAESRSESTPDRFLFEKGYHSSPSLPATPCVHFRITLSSSNFRQVHLCEGLDSGRQTIPERFLSQMGTSCNHSQPSVFPQSKERFRDFAKSLRSSVAYPLKRFFSGRGVQTSKQILRRRKQRKVFHIERERKSDFC